MNMSLLSREIGQRLFTEQFSVTYEYYKIKIDPLWKMKKINTASLESRW